MCFSSPKVPTPQAAPPPVTEQDPAVMASLDRERRRQAAALGKRSTMLSGTSGISAPATTAPKTFLGS